MMIFLCAPYRPYKAKIIVAIAIFLALFLGMKSQTHAAEPAKNQKDEASPSQKTAPKNFLQRLDSLGLATGTYPAENAIISVNPTLSIYRLVETDTGELLLAYGYATRDRQSVYRVWSLTHKQIRFEVRASPSEMTQIMTKLRDFLAPIAANSWPIRSLSTPYALSTERRAVLRNEGVCGGLYRYWLEWQGSIIIPPVKTELRGKQAPLPTNIPSFGRMIALHLDEPISYLIPPNCPLTLGSEANGDNLQQTVAGKLLSLGFAQAVQLGNGGMVVFAANAPVMIRFDASGNFTNNERGLKLVSIPMSNDRYTELINNSRAGIGRFGNLPLMQRFEANFNHAFP